MTFAESLKFKKLSAVGGQFLRGFNYNNSKIGDSSTMRFYDHIEQYPIDLQEIKDAGFNMVRHYINSGFDQTKLIAALDVAYAKGLKVMALMYVNYGTDYTISTGQSNRDTQISRFTTMINALKNHPAVIAYGFGSEANANLGAGTTKEDFHTLLNDACIAGKAIDSTRFYYTSGIEIGDCNNYDYLCPDLDVWGATIYRQSSDQVANEVAYANIQNTYTSSKPLVITEYGITAYIQSTGVVDRTNQATQLLKIAQALEKCPVIVGATIFNFAENVSATNLRDRNWGITEDLANGDDRSRTKYPAWDAIKNYSLNNTV